MADSKKQGVNAVGKNINIVTTINEATPEKQIVLTEEAYKKILENAVRVKELEMQATLGKEREIFQAQIDGLQNKLANLPESLKKEQETNAELVALLEQMGSKVAEKKFQKANDAFQENEFTKTDKILMEIEEKEKLSKKHFGEIAYARGTVAEKDLRWKDSVEHYARAAQLNPCFKALIKAQERANYAGDYNSALSFGLDAQKSAIKEYGKDSLQYAGILNDLGTVYNRLKDYKTAERLHTEALKIRQNKLGKKHQDVALSINNLGGIYKEQNQYREATYFFKRALNIYKETLGTKNPRTAITLDNLGGAYRELGEFKKAKPLLKQALKIRKEVLRDNHPDIASSLNNFGSLYFMQGQYKKAEPFIRQALEIFEATLGLEHPNTTLLKSNYELLKKDMANADKTTPKIKPMA